MRRSCSLRARDSPRAPYGPTGRLDDIPARQPKPGRRLSNRQRPVRVCVPTNYNLVASPATTAVPEPATAGTTLIGIAGMVVLGGRLQARK